MKDKSLLFIVTSVLYIMCIFAFASRVTVIAGELKEEVDQIEDDLLEYEEVFKEDQETDEDQLHDTIQYIDEDSVIEEDQNNNQDDSESDSILPDRADFEEDVELKDEIRPLLGATRSMVNTYNSDYVWLFKKNYYATSTSLKYLDDDGNNIWHFVYIFQKDKLPDYDLIEVFVNNNQYELLDSPNNDYYIVYMIDANGTNKNSLMSSVRTYLDNYGYPDSNCYWSAPEPTGEPTPTVTLTPTPEPMPDNENNEKYYIMMIFSFGLVAGIIAGHFLTGFIK